MYLNAPPQTPTIPGNLIAYPLRKMIGQSLMDSFEAISLKKADGLSVLESCVHSVWNLDPGQLLILRDRTLKKAQQ